MGVIIMQILMTTDDGNAQLEASERDFAKQWVIPR